MEELLPLPLVDLPCGVLCGIIDCSSTASRKQLRLTCQLLKSLVSLRLPYLHLRLGSLAGQPYTTLHPFLSRLAISTPDGSSAVPEHQQCASLHNVLASARPHTLKSVVWTARPYGISAVPANIWEAFSAACPTDLRSLSLGACDLAALERFMHTRPELQELHLSQAFAPGPSDLQLLAGLPQLRSLSLHLTSHGFGCLAALTALTSMELFLDTVEEERADGPLSLEAMGLLPRLTSLRWVGVSAAQAVPGSPAPSGGMA